MLLNQIRHPQLRTYFVWGPYIKGDSIAAARDASQRFVAFNAEHFWTTTHNLSIYYNTVLGLPQGVLAWDVFLVYGKGTRWEGLRPPAPSYWQHQLKVMQGAPYNIEALETNIVTALR